MKFTNGQWRIRDGITAYYARDLFEYSSTGDGLRAIVSSSPMHARADMINSTVLTLDITTPIRNVIGVRVRHFFGDTLDADRSVITREEITPVIDIRGRDAEFTSGDLTLKLNGEGVFSMDFIHGSQIISRAEAKAIGYFVDRDRDKSYIQCQLSVGVGEYIYGLGERFTPFVKNGQVVDMWQCDGGTSSEQAYKNVPFYLSNKGYGVFINTYSDVSFEVCSEHVERVGFSLEGEDIEYFFIYGDTPRDILERYTALTGRPALPPAWSFGLWLSTSFTTNYDEDTVTSFIDGMARRDIPVHVFHFDCFWMKGDHWVDFEWDADMFPDPRGMLRRYHDRGLKICLWINPYVAQASSLFEEAARKGYLIKKSNGRVWQTDLWQSGMGIVDFTNPKAVEWYQGHLERLLDMGVDCFKTDFGERIPVRGIEYYDGSDPVAMHNRYTQLYNRAVFDALERKRGRNEAVVFARSATFGGQSMPVHWGGDNSASYPSMAETLRGGLSLAVCGFGFWSHDIGGFEETAPPDVYKRWCAFGLLSSHSRLHGSSSYRVPWSFDEEAISVLRFFVKQKCRLMPYIYSHAVAAHRYGTPLLRPMVFDFMRDPAAATVDRQYMLGDSLLIAPVMSEDGAVGFYVPEGIWTDYISGKTYEGGRFYSGTYDYFSLPMLVREGTILPIGCDDSRPDYDYHKDLTLRIYKLADGCSACVQIPDSKGENEITIKAVRHGKEITITTSHALDGLNAEYAGRENVAIRISRMISPSGPPADD